jgi:hypothetical protein
MSLFANLQKRVVDIRNLFRNLYRDYAIVNVDLVTFKLVCTSRLLTHLYTKKEPENRI